MNEKTTKELAAMAHEINTNAKKNKEKKQALLKNLAIDKTERKNLYNCKKCGNTITTIDRDKGVTPMMLSCSAFNGCSDGMMFSFMYNVPPIIVPGYEWVKEPEEEVLNIKQIKQ